MAKTLTIYSGTTGINNSDDPSRLKWDPQTGITDLQAGVNIDIDKTLRASRRLGYTDISITDKASGEPLLGEMHSLFCDGPECPCLFVHDNELRRLYADYTSDPLAWITKGPRLSYARVSGKVYWMNGFEKGIVANGVNTAWGASGPIKIPKSKKVAYPPPVGHLVGHYNGFMYVAVDRYLWYSEPFAYSWFVLGRNRLPFSSRIRLFGAVKGCMFVSDSERIYSLVGQTPQDFIKEEVADYPAVEGSMVYENASRVGAGDLPGKVLLFTSSKGDVCLGGADGFFKNLTEDRLVLPGVPIGAGNAAVVNGKYICNMES